MKGYDIDLLLPALKTDLDAKEGCSMITLTPATITLDTDMEDWEFLKYLWGWLGNYDVDIIRYHMMVEVFEDDGDMLKHIVFTVIEAAN